MSETKIMLGNEAIARGAYEAGVKVSSAYPGTPSTEISENISGSLATLTPTIFIEAIARTPLMDAPIATSIATFSFGAHSA